MKNYIKSYWAKDKLYHAICGVAIWLLAIVLFYIAKEATTGEHWYNGYKEFPCTLVPVFLAGILKESVWDGLMDKGTPDLRDCIATVIVPTIIVCLIVFL